MNILSATCRYRPIRCAAWLAFLPALVGCPVAPVADPWQACIAEPNESCLLDLAQASLEQIPAATDWISAAVELTFAQQAAGRAAEAGETLAQAVTLLERVPDSAQRVKSLIEVAEALGKAGSKNQVEVVLAQGESEVGALPDEQTRFDLVGKLAGLRAASGTTAAALATAQSMPTTTENLASFKARALSEIAQHQAKQGDWVATRATLDSITMGLPYFASTARTQIAELVSVGEADQVSDLVAESEAIARSQTDGYFVAGALRKLGELQAHWGRTDRALPLFRDAVEHAKRAATPQERARALARVVTALADAELLAQAKTVIPIALGIAREEESELLRHWAFYEIAGAASFSGDFETAREILVEIPVNANRSGKSLRSATQRDVAWGLARHGRLNEAIELLQTTEGLREQVQGLSRVVRLMRNPGMAALPRYL